jgi:hypothetical protein
MAAGTRRITTTLAAAGVVENILAGSPLEYPGVASSVEVASACLQADIDQVTMDVLIGTDLVAEGIVVPINDTDGVGPKLPDNLLVVEAAGPADHVQVRIRMSAAATTYTLVRIQPV